MTPSALMITSARDAASMGGSFFPLGNVDAAVPPAAGQATATCFCGGVQLQFSTEKPGLVDTFLCNCTDCRKITASMFASNFIINNDSLKHLRGEDLLSTYAQSRTIATGNTMTNYFCWRCGTLMYRVSSGAPGRSVLRLGTVDDFNLHETKLKPRLEQFCKDRVGWLNGASGVTQVEGNYYAKWVASLLQT